MPSDALKALSNELRTSAARECGRPFPELIHQTWRETQLPGHLQAHANTWKEMHPDFGYRLWTDQDNHRLIAEQYPELLSCFEQYPFHICRVDVVRYLYLLEFGGIYCDLDTVCLKPLTELFELDADVILGFMGRSPTFEHAIPNAVMISRRGADFWRFVAEQLLNDFPYSTRARVFRPEYLTGPVFLKRCYETYQQQCSRPSASRIVVLDADAFFPIAWNEQSGKRRRRALLQQKGDLQPESLRKEFPASFCLTYWEHSWSEQTPVVLPKRFVRKMSKVFRKVVRASRRRLLQRQLRRESMSRNAVRDYGILKVPIFCDGDEQEISLHLHHRRWLSREQQRTAPFITPGDIVFDIGANLGVLTAIFSASVGQDGRVYAFEPASATFAKLVAIQAASNWSNVELHQLACGDASGSALLYAVGRDSGYSTLCPPVNADVDPIPPERVGICTLDEFVFGSGISRVDFIKIDSEGFEAKVLAGAAQVLRSFRPVVYLELCREYHRNAQAAIDLLLQLEYYFPELPDFRHAANGTNFFALPNRAATPMRIGGEPCAHTTEPTTLVREAL
ncbi:MAG: FkbM family methyltransferase [Bdellovibrionales bacterium]|nr:FkbM family methyltransferase [Bdellovibrionales bacterium]